MLLTQIAHSEQNKLSTYCTPQVYRGVPTGYEKKAPHVTTDYCTEVLHALLFEIIQLMMQETNRCYHPYLSALDEGQSPLPDMTVQEIIDQMGHNQKDNMKDCWWTHERFNMAFYGNIKHDKFFNL
jgi:hypothetical protein